ncbi:glucoamylase family protein [Roseiflexus sp.]|uniref:glucoamylase family protein n=1 Tax=Roseiflexus sp. TaxID=2562120 RepID=UPI00398B0A92
MSTPLSNKPHTEFLDTLARDTWTYLRSDRTTKNHLPYSWWSPTLSGGDYANPAEIGLYALSWLAAYDLGRSWSPSWDETNAEITAILDQLRVWQTGAQTSQPHGPNAYQNSVFYQWYWISWNPPVVGAHVGDNHLAPSVDNAWLAAALMTIREYAAAHNHTTLVQKAEAILADMDFRLWYHPDSHRFSWGDVENPQGGTLADYYSNENRIINVVARALGHLSAEEFRQSLDALEGPSGNYSGVTVEKMAWDGSYFTYAAPALFIREVDTSYGRNTLIPATQAQIAYAQNQSYAAWGLSDCYDVGDGGYVQQGAPPVPAGVVPETRPGLVTPHAAGLALITPLATEAITNLQALSATFPCLYTQDYGFRDAVMARSGDASYGRCSDRYSALAQEWLFLGLVNHETGFIWRYFYRHPGVLQAHIEMYGGAHVYLPLILRNRGP